MIGEEFLRHKVLLNGSHVNSSFWSSKHMIVIQWEGQSKEIVHGTFEFDYFVQLEWHYAGKGALKRTLEATDMQVFRSRVLLLEAETHVLCSYMYSVCVGITKQR